jgi:catechol 2,3-dioxygenase
MIQRIGVAPPHYRLPDATRVGAVRLQVANVQRSVAFYDRVLGLFAREEDDGAALTARAARQPLIHLRERPGARSARGEFGLYHFAILLPDRAALGRFASHILRLGVRVGTADHLVSESFYLSDPDGLGIEVYADRPRDAWRQHGDEIAMATDPLDIESVIEAGGGEPWRGMPAATRMGHIHLHVGDLAAANAFYHLALGFDRMVWSYPGALFLAAGGYHHHLGTNVWSNGPVAAEDQARLLDWELVVPAAADAAAAARSLREAGHAVEQRSDAWMAADPWATRLRIVATASA